MDPHEWYPIVASARSRNVLTSNQLLRIKEKYLLFCNEKIKGTVQSAPLCITEIGKCFILYLNIRQPLAIILSLITILQCNHLRIHQMSLSGVQLYALP